MLNGALTVLLTVGYAVAQSQISTTTMTTGSTTPTRTTFSVAPTTPPPCACGTTNWLQSSPSSSVRLPPYNSAVYAAGCTCTYIVKVPTGYVVSVRPYTYYGQPPASNTLTITDPISGTVIETCHGGGNCSSVLTTSSYAQITLKNVVSSSSIYTIYASGYSTAPTTTPPPGCPCGGQPLQNVVPGGPAVWVQSPNYPNKYPNNCRCSWTVQTGKGNKVMINVKNSQLESGYDQVCFFAGTNPATAIRLFCCTGNTCDQTGQSVDSASTNTTVTFYSDSSVTRPGFQASFTAAKMAPCDNNPCLSGSCVNNGNSAQCICSLGFTGNLCSLPGCFYTVQNNGAYVLRVSYSSSAGASSFTLVQGSQSFFTATADTTVTLGAVLGASTSFNVQQSFQKKAIVCGGTSIAGFNCQVN